MLKADLRKSYLSRQRDLSDEERLDRSLRISGLFFRSFDLEKVKYLHLFLPIEKNKEIETKFIYERIQQDFPQIKTVIPRVDFEKDILESIEFSSDTELTLNKWQIFESDAAKSVEPQMIDMVLVPLLCFDKNSFRVGYGKGFYDKFLGNCKKDCLKIGLSYFPPIEEISDTHPKDVMLDYCITPDEIWKN